MARTLFWLEAAALLLLSALFAHFGRMGAETFAIPLAVAVLLPFAAVLAVWPAKKLVRAFMQALSPGRPGPGGRESLRILGALADFSVLGGIAGSLGAARILLDHGMETMDAIVEFDRILAFLLFGILYALCVSVLKASLARASERPVNGDIGEGLPSFAGKYGLSARETEVAASIARGLSYKETADGLHISVKTVKTHITHLYSKTSCSDRVAFILLLRAETANSYKRPRDGASLRNDD
ncbi:MAG TPA: helix-turn-helix transcriptional regulator [Rectinemataceae bacterium]|nr:helix-turn-helix transcriptional regulator [Rectinemataceae bacterium]